MSVAVECEVCNGTGWDDTFGSECGACDAHLPTAESVQEAKAAYAVHQDQVKRFTEEKVVLIEWLKTFPPDDEFATSIVRQFNSKGELSTKQWDAIERMRAQADSGLYRFGKVGQEWVIYGPEGISGSKVTVTKADGTTKEAWLGEMMGVRVRGQATYICQWDDPKVKLPTIVEGMWINDQEQVFRVKESKTGNLYAEELHKALEGNSWGWEYVGRKPFKTPGFRLMTLEEAKEFGQYTTTCCCCGRQLTNPESVEDGIGPYCKAKWF